MPKTHSLLEDLREFIAVQKLLLPSDKILLSVSGGVDSVVLAYLCRQLGYPLGIAHVNYQLRDNHSDMDQQLVRNLADNWQVPFHILQCDTVQYAQEKGISIQMATRELRYRWLDEIREQYDYDKIATGHHLNDSVETIILNLVRGTGISGLRGILPLRERVVRPLLFATKMQIMEFAKSLKLEWREDLSNRSHYYQRNLIRNQVIPLLKKINPDLEATMQNTAEILRSVELEYHQNLENIRNKVVEPHGEDLMIKKEALTSIPAPVLYEILNHYGFNYQQCKSLISPGKKRIGKIFISEAYILNVDRDHVIISQKETFAFFGKIQGPNQKYFRCGEITWSLDVSPYPGYSIPRDPSIGAWDLDKLKFPLKLRGWQSGDWFHPLGMSHRKKLSDFLIDRKIPRTQKEKITVVVSGTDIIWVVGYRIDDRYKITAETRRVFQIDSGKKP